MNRLVSFFFLLIFCLSTFAVPASQPLVHTYQLPNGLQLFVKEDHRMPLVMTQIWYRVGSGYESAATSGISHVVEHMISQGTANSTDEFNRIIRESGGHANAFTSRDYTVYYEELPANLLSLALRLEADRMSHLSLNTTNFVKERQAVLQERQVQIDDNPYATTYERLIAEAYIGSPYQYLPIGSVSSLQNLSLEDIQTWYQQRYVPNNAFIIVVGDVVPQQVYQWVQQYFAPLHKVTLPVIKPQPGMSALGIRSANVRLSAQMPWFILSYKVPSIKSAPQSNDPYILSLMAWILNHKILDNRLGKQTNPALVTRMTKEIDVKAHYNPYVRLDSLFVVAATPRAGTTLPILRTALLMKMEELQKRPFTPQELAQIKVAFIADHVYRQDSLISQANAIGRLEAIGLSWQLNQQFIKHISDITAKQIQMLAQRYFRDHDMSQARLRPVLPFPEHTIVPSPLGDDNVR